MNDGETFLDMEVVTVGGIRLRAHAATVCDPSMPCVIHRPSDHPMRSWKLHWRDDRGIFERICPAHGVGHPDPDQLDYWRSIGRGWEAVHGCCGCHRGV